MKPNQERIEALFEAARHLASRAEQAAYLDRACGECHHQSGERPNDNRELPHPGCG